MPVSRQDRTAAPPGRAGRGNRDNSERRFERGVALRAGFYIFGTHVLAGFIWLLFYVGEHAHK
ncbi:DUF6126 family protein [Streptomyces coelicoflavus]|uniref:Small hydrophobic protein n=1 Tax=Streptomyces coelicoflavus TaxID=285562 RepID=A0A6N9V0F4_9ACTN|nr:DUF6126 family protein [Streptomyces coelicoflavus]NEB22376.1 hypothetical protein [Streptomyces coelicoflavus]OWA14452.1 hypothetical protein B9W64_17510 [Streptomyces sp. CS159]